ncbi:MAG: HlyD family efflux transporter periplasmic adaptor subunit [Arcobacteraceae bacterium]|nr:HlyD family efflux transporter periplasmic adaptor subunit [Arcobacteraceae bacterium]
MDNKLATLLQLEQNGKNCESLKELYYLITNETSKLIDYNQAFLLGPSITSTLEVVSISNITTIDSTSPFNQWLENIALNISKSDKANIIHSIDTKKELDKIDQSQLKEYVFGNLLWIPLKKTQNNIEIYYVLILSRETPWKEHELKLLEHIANSYAYFLFASRKCSLISNIKNFKVSNKYLKYSLAGFIIIMLIPVKMSIVAPVEIQAKNPFIVTAPIKGVIKSVDVLPNQSVKEGDLVVRIEDSEYKSKYEISNKILQVARAQLHSTSQVSFLDYTQKSKLSELETQVQLKIAEAEFAQSELEKTKIYAKQSGIAIVHNPKELEGKPVEIGEKILFIANPNDIEIKVMVPVGDAIFLESNTPVKVFLDNEPLKSWEGKVTQISYKPELTVQNILSYKIVGELNFDDDEEKPKIGVRGTAKLYSQNVTLFFYLFRKPITTLREWIGW